ncbi:MBL fold metallo-hydrolase [Corynebacterium sp. ES2794-CONJ1]|uniref:MBL fold metallo-hydrolase n=1 Tax=unclassified Corynebacterium TaxID=2624378 RepID=UPI0021674F89|nr:MULTISPECIES: MBL fold metallo-hydrolase [unclassified Corynebacterium]MCS4490747.1 MBL fold metallo-hydrolase [Corynebacterium sp. ES2775-CONJ]MCS4492549.1 MBL fold metallo-hydrolase [Corynebacterium sp. ES2715-CONJ3]MCS4532650.1 MBL fold metallo-hydrolase [Corynebacterium sp. ES2730-CONJ]MCU9520045.1 MBL fold metallo-hydrolase [Corynebacterium sp. ES2794-CONJ1]
MDLDILTLGTMDNKSYALSWGDRTLLIDAPAQAETILQWASRNERSIDAVLTTHSHADHVGALVQVLSATGAHHYASALDAPDLPAPVDTKLSHGDTLEFYGQYLQVIILRGHTRGGACLALHNDGTTHLFVGDSLFPGGLGKTDSPAEFKQLFSDVSARLFDRFSDDAIVWPGHGKPTTIGAERPALGEWEKRGW